MTAPLPTVSVVIPVLDDADHLRTCLGLLARQTLRPLEVVVVDNGSQDDSVAVATLLGARVVHEPSAGIPAAAAAGYDAARGDVIARLDADSRPGPGWVARVARRMADPDIDALTGTGRFVDLPRGSATVLSVAYLGSYYVLTYLALGHQSLWGSSMAIRRVAWLAVGAQVRRDDAGVHDDLDLAFALGPERRTALDLHLRVGVSARSLRGRAQWHRRVGRARRTLRLNWAVRSPFDRWRDRVSAVRRGRPRG